MRILWLLTQDMDGSSALGRYLPLARQLVRSGHSVRIAALHPDLASLPSRELQVDGVQVQYVAPMHIRKHGSQRAYYPPLLMPLVAAWAALRLALAALSAPADLIWVGKPQPMNGLAGLVAARLRRLPLWLDCDDYEAASNNFAAGWQRRIVAFFEDRLPAAARLVTTNTLFMKERLERLGIPPGRLVHLPNGFDSARFQMPAEPAVVRLRDRLGLRAGQPVVGFIGSLSLANHAVDLLLEAFQRVQAACPDARLLLVGGGEDYAALQTLVEKMGMAGSVLFTGRVDPAEVALYYRLCAVSVDPVYADDAARGRSPLKLFESWALGIPFVTADVGDRAALLGDPPAGLLAQPGDAASLAAAVLRVLDSPDLREQLAMVGLERSCCYTWERLTREIVSPILQGAVFRPLEAESTPDSQ